MKYLIFAKPGDTNIPREQGADIISASLDWIRGKLADGTLDCTYNLFDGGGFGIANADSHEEILGIIMEMPVYPFFIWEVTPILDMEQSSEMYIENYRRISST